MILCGICYVLEWYIVAPQIGVGYNGMLLLVLLSFVIATPQILYEVYGINHIQTHTFERGEYLAILAVIRAFMAFFIKNGARVVGLVSTDHKQLHNPATQPTRKLVGFVFLGVYIKKPDLSLNLANLTKHIYCFTFRGGLYNQENNMLGRSE